jgi:ubiquinone/menaquinone biosynthesis C-methylase UbiE
MGSYYQDNLSAERLRQCYDIAPPRVRQYLDAEIAHVCQKLHSTDVFLELGCGYGRIIPQLAANVSTVVGIDNSFSSLRMGQTLLREVSNCSMLQMDAISLAFCDQCFDAVVCIQNGISAFHVDKNELIAESIRVTKSGGRILFSSYSDRFWNDRLEWFRLQADAGLLGKIDMAKTGKGRIFCVDGFTATTISPDEFKSLSLRFDVTTRIVEVDNSSVFCEMVRR